MDVPDSLLSEIRESGYARLLSMCDLQVVPPPSVKTGVNFSVHIHVHVENSMSNVLRAVAQLL